MLDCTSIHIFLAIWGAFTIQTFQTSPPFGMTQDLSAPPIVLRLLFNNNSSVADTEYMLLQINYERDVFINLKHWLGIWHC